MAKPHYYIGIDPGYTKGSIVMIQGGKFIDYKVIKIPRKKSETPLSILDRARRVIRGFEDTIWDMIKKKRFTHTGQVMLCIEEPVYSWGRRNPRVFSKQTALFYLMLDQLSGDYKIRTVNNQTAKKATGVKGKKTKEKMIKAFTVASKVKLREPKYAQETIADSYFIAQAGYAMRKRG